MPIDPISQIFIVIVAGIILTVAEITLSKIKEYLRDIRTKRKLHGNAYLVKKMLPNGSYRIATGFLKHDHNVRLVDYKTPERTIRGIAIFNDDPDIEPQFIPPGDIDDRNKSKVFEEGALLQSERIDGEVIKYQEGVLVTVPL